MAALRQGIGDVRVERVGGNLDLHQGQIGLESTLGMGSRFWFSVPMSQQPARVAA